MNSREFWILKTKDEHFSPMFFHNPHLLCNDIDEAKRFGIKKAAEHFKNTHFPNSTMAKIRMTFEEMEEEI